jgi:hypothetical protein
MRKLSAQSSKANSIIVLSILSIALNACVPIPNSASLKSGSSDQSSHTDSGPSTDIPVEKVAVEKKGRLINRAYIKNLFSEVFNSVTYPNDVFAYDPGFVVNLMDNLINTPSVFGNPCDQYSSSGDLDCGGSIVSGSSAAIYPESTAALQMNFTNLCEVILTKTNAVKAAAEKIGEVPAGTLNEISTNNIPKIFSLFFRQRDITPAELSAYTQFNNDLVARGKTKTERWSAILQMVCESPEWQSL